MYDNVIYRTHGLASQSLPVGRQAPFSRLQTCLNAQPGRSAPAWTKKTIRSQLNILSAL